jgi:hypothetical protein
MDWDSFQLMSIVSYISLSDSFPCCQIVPEIYAEWRRLVVTFGVSGVQVHDARLVAAMNVNRITHILTLNTADFIRYASEGIVAVNPATLLEEFL